MSNFLCWIISTVCCTLTCPHDKKCARVLACTPSRLHDNLHAYSVLAHIMLSLDISIGSSGLLKASTCFEKKLLLRRSCIATSSNFENAVAERPQAWGNHSLCYQDNKLIPSLFFNRCGWIRGCWQAIIHLVLAVCTELKLTNWQIWLCVSKKT